MKSAHRIASRHIHPRPKYTQLHTNIHRKEMVEKITSESVNKLATERRETRMKERKKNAYLHLDVDYTRNIIFS